jgi:hypothetical protein
MAIVAMHQGPDFDGGTNPMKRKAGIAVDGHASLC